MTAAVDETIVARDDGAASAGTLNADAGADSPDASEQRQLTTPFGRESRELAARIPLARRPRRAHISIGSGEDPALVARQASEESLRDDVVDLARRYGWRVYFTR